MGYFSFLYCDSFRKGKERPLRIGEEAYIPFPKDRSALGIPAGSILHETSYDGYGHFADIDIFELVAEWNKGLLSASNLEKPVRSMWNEEEYYQKALRQYENNIKKLNDFQSGKNNSYMESHYGKYWLRELGIDIACYDHQNASLAYPLKVCRKRSSVYENVPASKGDPNQGL